MAKIAHFSEATNLAIHSLGYLGQVEAGDYRSASEIAGQLAVSEAHLGKVLQRLAKFGLVRSVRGAKGGFAIAREPGQVTLLEIVELMEGPLEVSDCLLGKPVCERRQCVFGALMRDIDRLVRQRLSSTHLSDLGMTVRSAPANRRPKRRGRRRR